MNSRMDIDDSNLNELELIENAAEEKPKVTYVCGGNLLSQFDFDSVRFFIHL